jgi:ATP-binding protein involved in chromosome partitioning
MMTDKCTEQEDQKKLAMRLQRVRHKIIVLSGKGGVGKSTVAVNLAGALAATGRRVGLMDVDIHGPSIPGMLGLHDAGLLNSEEGIEPVEKHGVKIMSMGFVLREHDQAVIWRGPMKMGVIKQFLSDVNWGDLDYLIIDSPPGTGDEPLSVCQLAAPLDGAVVVTTPQSVAIDDVRRSVNFCHQLHLRVLGVVENMSGFACPGCGLVSNIFHSGGGEVMAQEMGVPFLGRIPLDLHVREAGDAGALYAGAIDSPAQSGFKAILTGIIQLCEGEEQKETKNGTKDTTMKIAIPLANGQLCMHFGHCEQFALVEADAEKKTVKGITMLTPPAHEPGVLPRWLHEQGANVILAGGMGSRAQALFAENNIQVVVGAAVDTPENLAIRWLSGKLESGTNVCDH